MTRFQQTTGPVTAKGVEDTAFYRYVRLTALNEVGGDPGRFSLPVDDFHRANLERAERFPNHLLATQTHDTKRSGDVRARIVALAALADEWAARALAAGARSTTRTRTSCSGRRSSARGRSSRERIEAYVEKALREAKVNTSWVEPDERARTAGEGGGAARRARAAGRVRDFAARVAALGRTNSLAMTLLKLTVPGVPDLYQGDERESLSLVDPDNRRPVDWSAAPDAKTRVVREALALRARRTLGEYRPLDLGPDVCAFLRGDDVAVVVPLRGQDPPEPELPGSWTDLLPGLPVRLLERREQPLVRLARVHGDADRVV